MRTYLRGKLTLLFMSFALMLALPAMALADTLQINNTLVVGSNVSKDPGQSGIGKVWLDASDNSTDTQNGCNATNQAPVIVTFTSSDTSKIANPAPVTLTSCGTTAAQDFSYSVEPSATAGTVQIKGAVSGGRGGTYNTSDTLTVTINAPVKQNSSISDVSGSGTYGGNSTLTAKLSSGANNLSGKNVAFELNGQAVGTDATDANGVAELSGVSLSGINAGTYNNAVSANFVGDSAYNGSSGSGNLSVAKAAGSVSINNIPSNAVFGGSFTPDYTKAGDGTASTSSNTPSVCSVSSGVVSFDAAGTCTLQASVAEGTNHLAANGSEQTFQIAKAPASLSFAAGTLSKTYDGSAQSVTVDTTPANLSGLSISYSQNGTPIANPTNAGTYDVVATLDNPNYQASQLTGTLVIDKAEATIKVNGYTGTYDGDAHGATGTATGVKGEDLSSLLDLGDSFTNVPGGTANWSFAGNGNYNSANGTTQIVINKATATVQLSGLGPYIYDGTAKAATATTTPSGLNVQITYSQGNNPVTNPTNVGSYNVLAKITDNNYQGQATGTLVINSLTTKGFYQPVDMGGVYNTVKGGSTVPLKFELFAGATELTDTGSVKTLEANKVSCTSGAAEDAIEVTATGGTSLRYDTTGGQFIYNWKTPTGAGSCYKVTVTANDGSTISAFFKTR
jgi:hypothetical protein